MKFRALFAGILCVLTMLPVSAMAVNTVLSGIFDGSESKIAPLPGTCNEPDPLGYQNAGTFQVTASGDYVVTEAYNVIGIDTSVLIYQGSFNPASPQTNLVTPNGVDDSELVVLDAGVDYVLVVQHWCNNPDRVWVVREGAWSAAFSGPGEVVSDKKVSVPAMTQGVFSANDPVADTDCGNSQYQQIGPVQVNRPGTYYYADISLNYDVDMCLQVYSAPFDSGNPNSNRIGPELDDWGSFELEAGKDYYFVVQPLQEPAEGEFFFVLPPPAPFFINYAISGSWYFPPTTGQGFLIDVFDTNNLMFLAWFTYDLERPAADVTAMIGEPGHRWMTAAGPFQGTIADLGITWSSGMIFDSETPAVTNDNDGTMEVEFYNCYSGVVRYDLGASGRSGEVPIERIVADAGPLCETLHQGPAAPGPL